MGLYSTKNANVSVFASLQKNYIKILYFFQIAGWLLFNIFLLHLRKRKLHNRAYLRQFTSSGSTGCQDSHLRMYRVPMGA